MPWRGLSSDRFSGCLGWLFAELRYELVALLLFAPLAGAVVNLIPFPRGNAFLSQNWDGGASAAVSAVPACIAILTYLAEMAEFEGY